MKAFKIIGICLIVCATIGLGIGIGFFIKKPSADNSAKDENVYAQAIYCATSHEMVVNSHYQIEVFTNPTNITQTIYFSSSNTSVAVVDESGLVYACDIGVASVSATTFNKNGDSLCAVIEIVVCQEQPPSQDQTGTNDGVSDDDNGNDGDVNDSSNNNKSENDGQNPPNDDNEAQPPTQQTPNGDDNDAPACGDQSGSGEIEGDQDQNPPTNDQTQNPDASPETPANPTATLELVIPNNAGDVNTYSYEQDQHNIVVRKNADGMHVLTLKTNISQSDYAISSSNITSNKIIFEKQSSTFMFLQTGSLCVTISNANAQNDIVVFINVQ